LYLAIPLLIGAILLARSPASPPALEPALRPVSCWFKTPADRSVTCYRLRVPESRAVAGPAGAAPAGRAPAAARVAPAGNSLQLDLPIVVISSPHDRQHNDPVIYISGGPGDGDWLDADRIPYWWDFLADNPWLRHRDLILFDQRGVGMTEPRADCPEIAALNISSLAYGNDHQKEADFARAAAQACLTRLQGEGHDAGAYTTEASAEDLHDIFQALKLPRWNIYGLSYGTRLALTYLRLHPTDIRSVILDSVYPPQVRFLEDDAARTDHAFQLIFDACVQDAACRRWYPDLSKRFLSLVDRLNATPLMFSRINPDDKTTLRFPFTGETLLTHLFFNLYNRSDIERIPQIIDIFDRHLPRALDLEIDRLIDELDDRPDWGDAMSTTIDCLEDVPFNDPAKVQANYRASPLLHSFADADSAPLCPVWVQRPPVAAMNIPVESDLPSLVLAGSNDPVTPPDYAQRAAGHLSRSFYLEFPGIGHDVLGNSPCAARLAEQFLNAPGTQPADDCLAKANPLDFVPPASR